MLRKLYGLKEVCENWWRKKFKFEIGGGEIINRQKFWMWLHCPVNAVYLFNE